MKSLGFLNRELTVVLVQVDLDGFRRAGNVTQFELLKLTLDSLVAPTHINFLLLSLIVSKDAQDVFHHRLSLLFSVLFLGLSFDLLQVLHRLSQDVFK